MISRDKINYSYPVMKLITVNFFFSENSYYFKHQFVHLLSFKNRSSDVDENKLNTVYVDYNDKDIFIPFWQTWKTTKSSKIKLFKSDFQGSSPCAAEENLGWWTEQNPLLCAWEGGRGWKKRYF